uniref:C2H2-type domain-containing protein n=1 Tax=Hubei sobemo-like virus 21 TaxID=1923207 RepID=A0A1L3KEB6_9VIRU|nr:hypothetical protein 1 [Hubei sobemo-like virus 21]
MAIMKMGVLSDVHIGYALRIGDFLVTPLHVLVALGPHEKTMMVANCNDPKRKYVMGFSGYVKSKLFPDLAYLKLDQSKWSLLGVSMARVAKDSADKATPQVECVGMKRNKSIGFIRKTDRIGVYSYSGSTIPGMSGAGYFYGNILIGLHDGAQGDINVGFSASAVAREMGTIFEAEASEDMLNIDSKTRDGLRKMGWTDRDVEQWCAGAWREDDSWAQRISAANTMAKGESSKKNVGIKIGKIGVTLPSDVIKTQATEPNVIHLDPPAESWETFMDLEACAAQAELDPRIEEITIEEPSVKSTTKLGVPGSDLEERVRVLELLVTGLLEAQEVFETKQKEKEAEFVETLEMRVLARLNDVKEALRQEVASRTAAKARKCPGCNRICPSLSSLRNHRRKHCENSIPMEQLKKTGAIKKESAFVADRIKTVKEKPFLDRHPNSRIARDSPYYNTLSTKEPNQNCPASEGNPSGTLAYQSGVSRDLRKRLERMVGRTSGGGPN